MVRGKRGIASYILIVAFVSFVISLLFISILSSFFKQDPINCKDYDYEILNRCKDNSNLRLVIKNNVDKKFGVEVGGMEYFDLPPKENKNINFKFEEKSVSVIPYFEDNMGTKNYCNSLSKKIDVMEVLKC